VSLSHSSQRIALTSVFLALAGLVPTLARSGRALLQARDILHALEKKAPATMLQAPIIVDDLNSNYNYTLTMEMRTPLLQVTSGGFNA
jgi:hypothetical protein